MDSRGPQALLLHLSPAPPPTISTSLLVMDKPGRLRASRTTVPRTPLQDPRALNPPSLPSQWVAILEQPQPGDSLLTPDSCVTSALPIHQPALWALPSKPIQHLPLSCKDTAPLRAPVPYGLDELTLPPHPCCSLQPWAGLFPCIAPRLAPSPLLQLFAQNSPPPGGLP